MNTRHYLTLLICTLLAANILTANDKHAVKLNTDIFPYTLSIDGRSTLPQIFFFNTDKGDFTYLRPQVDMAAKAGVHIYSFPLIVHMRYPTDEPDFAHAEKLIETFIAVDPQATFLVRLVLGPTWSWKAYNKKNDATIGEYFTYADGTTSGSVSFASDAFLDPTSVQLAKIVRHFEAKYPERMLVYQVAPELSEMFDVNYREKGPDYSAANTMAFRRYLKERYGDAAALRRAWGDDQVDFSNARVPMPEQGRFPMTHVTDRRINAFYKPVEERAWIDYSEFYSKLISGHVIRWCRIVKEETNGNKMTAAFYGYLFTLPGSFAGHFNLAEVLDSEYVDILCSPMSYVDRAVGGPGSFMSPVDSVIRHKKLWINEDDTRTHVIDVERHGGNPGFGATTTLDETIGVIDRNIATILAHGCGIWWMDLGASGAYNSREVWDLINARQAFFRNSEEPSKSTSADVQLIVDETSRMYIASDYSFSRSVYQRAITCLNRSSATVESYLFSDYVAGKTPKADLVVFATTFRMSAEQVSAVQQRLARDRSHRVWCFLPGYIDGDVTYDTAHVEKLTGFSIKLVPGRVASTGTYGNFRDVKLVEAYDNLDLEERPVVSSEGCTIIGNYDADGMASCAMKSSGGIYSFYIGSPGSTVELFRSIFETASVHLWADRPAVIKETGKYLFAYTGKAGQLTLNIPDGVELRAVNGDAVSTTDNRASLTMDGKGVQWFEHEAKQTPGKVVTTETARAGPQAGVFRILFNGNSITRHGPAPGIGWTNHCGMAASSEASDFVHLFADMVAATRPETVVEICLTNSNAYSKNGYKEELPQHQDEFHTQIKGLCPDLVIYQAGEAANLNDPEWTQWWREEYDGLLNAFLRHINPRPKVIAVSTWAPYGDQEDLLDETYPPTTPGGKIARIQRACCAEAGVPFVSVARYALDPACHGTGESDGVRWHPNDAGMRGYALELFKAYLEHYGLDDVDAEAELAKAVRKAGKQTGTTQSPTTAGSAVIYNIKAGDTLEKISQKFFENEENAKVILETNQDIFGQPPAMPKPGTPIIIPMK